MLRDLHTCKGSVLACVRKGWRCLSTAAHEQQLEDRLRSSISGVQHVKVGHNCTYLAFLQSLEIGRR